jgi:hypothetical protein
MLPTTPIYVAETNEVGQIDCVWYAASDQRAARPVQSPHKHLALLDQAHLHMPYATGWRRVRDVALLNRHGSPRSMFHAGPQHRLLLKS